MGGIELLVKRQKGIAGTSVAPVGVHILEEEKENVGSVHTTNDDADSWLEPAQAPATVPMTDAVEGTGTVIEVPRTVSPKDVFIEPTPVDVPGVAKIMEFAEKMELAEVKEPITAFKGKVMRPVRCQKAELVSLSNSEPESEGKLLGITVSKQQEDDE